MHWCADEEAAQADTATAAGPEATFQSVHTGQEQASQAKPAPQQYHAAQAQPQAQPQQPATSHSQEAQEATESAADRSADTARLSSGGGRYLSVPPSSLWGPPAGLALTTQSPAAQSAGTERQDLPSTGVDVPEDTGHSQYDYQDQSMQQRLPQPSAVEPEGAEGQAADQHSTEEDASMAETEVDLARAQRAQREALQTEAASLQSSRQALLEVKETIQQEQEGRMSQGQDQGMSSSMTAQSDTGGRQGGELASVEEADREADDSVVGTGAMLSDRGAPYEGEDRHVVEDMSQTEAAVAGAQEGDQEGDTSVTETQAALAGAQEAQQQAVQAQQEALADQRQTLMHLRQDLQQASGQLSPDAACFYAVRCTHTSDFTLVPCVRFTLNRPACHGLHVLASPTRNHCPTWCQDIMIHHVCKLACFTQNPALLRACVVSCGALRLCTVALSSQCTIC